MTRKQMLFKKLLDRTMFISYVLLIFFMVLIIFSVTQNALQFEDFAAPIIKEEFTYLRMVYMITIAGLILFVILARVFLSFVTQEDKLETIDEYRQRVGKNQTQLRIKDNQLLFDEIKYKPRKERERSIVPQVLSGEISVKDIVDKEKKEEIKIEITKQQNDKKFYTRLNKKELNGIISRVLDTSMYRSRKFVNSLLSIIQDELVLGNEVKIDHFGKFYVHTVEAHIGVNPSTGEKIQVDEHRIVKFKPYKQFKDDITNDVIATSDRYLLTKTSLKTLDELEVSEELQKEKDASDHIELSVTKPMNQQYRKTTTPKKTKKDIIERLSKESNISKNKANKFLNSFLEVISEQLAKKEDINIQGLGVFTTIHIPEKVAVNPQTNEQITVPEHDQIKLRFSKEFKDKFKS